VIFLRILVIFVEKPVTAVNMLLNRHSFGKEFFSNGRKHQRGNDMILKELK